MTTSQAQIVSCPGDQTVREEAVRARTNAIVTAGAGTGKTTLLISAALSRLLDDGIDVRRLLLLTFTDKAANDMRTRLRKALEERRLSTDGVSAQRARSALENLSQAQISTIHAFCARLLREYPIEAGIDPSFTVDEGPRLRTLFQSEWERWLDQELARHAPRRAIWLRLLESWTLTELRPVAEALCRFHVPSSALNAEQIRNQGEATLKKICDEAISTLDVLSSRCARPSNNLATQMRETMHFLRQWSNASVPRKAQSSDSRGWHPSDFHAASLALASARSLANDVAGLDEERIDEAISLLCEFATRFRTTYTAAGYVSFDGLLSLTQELLSSDTFPTVRAVVRERFDFILVDEFQDTDPIQCEILLRLAQDAAGRLVPGRLFIVGDPKQSIYSFRGADITAYERVKQTMLQEGAQEFVLRTNFRSHVAILDVVNAIFPHIITPRADLQPPYEPIEPEPHRNAPAVPSVELVVIKKENGRLHSDEARHAEAEVIARWIAEATPHRAYKDVAILLKALSDAHLYTEALRERGIPYVVAGEKFFYGTQEIIDFSNLLRAIANPNDTLALAGLLRSPLGAIDDPHLQRLAQEKTLDYRTPSNHPHVARLYALLRELHAYAQDHSVASLIDEIFRRTSVLELAAASASGEQAVANLVKLRQKVRALPPPSLPVFLHDLQRSIQALDEEAESPLADETLDAVRVMSIHKAKGLEFPVVIVADLHRELQGRREEPPVRYDWPSGTLGIRLGSRCNAGAAALSFRERQRHLEEDKRVPYVALTRAREHLLLLGSADFSHASMMGVLAKGIEAAGGPSLQSLDAPMIQMGKARLHVRHHLWREPRAKTSAPARPSETSTEPWDALAAAWRKREEEYERILATPRVAPLWEAPSTTKVEILCRQALDRLDFSAPCIEVPPGPHAAEARATLERFLRSEAFAELARAQILARAVPFFRKQGDSLITGIIDLIYRVGRRSWIGLWCLDGAATLSEAGKRAMLHTAERTVGRKAVGVKIISVRDGTAQVV